MAEPLADLPAGVSVQADQVLRKIGEVCCLYHRLILVVGPAVRRPRCGRCSPGWSRSR